MSTPPPSSPTPPPSSLPPLSPPLNKPLPYTDDELRNYASRFKTPFHLYDEKSLRESCREMREAFNWVGDKFRNYFAVKATPTPRVLQILKDEGCGADCSSMAELILAQAVGFKGEEIMFTSNNTPLIEYQKARQLGAIINIDDMSHIQFLHENGGLPELICFRYNPGPQRQGNVIIGAPQEAKFGVTTDQLFDCYKQAKDLGVKRFGLHTMVVSNCLDPEELVETALMIFDLVVRLKNVCGIDMDFVNLGGGIGVAYNPAGPPPVNMKSLSERIRVLYEGLLGRKDVNIKPFNIVYECGRVLTGPAGVLVTRVTHQKDIYKKFICVDGSMCNLMRPGMYGAYHHISVVKDQGNKNNIKLMAQLPSVTRIFKDKIPGDKFDKYDVVGGLCENNDKFAVDRVLQNDIEIGDILIIHDAGAHGHAMGFNYNGRLRSAEYLKTVGGELKVIRRGETYRDLFAPLKWFGSLPGKTLFDCEAVKMSLALICGAAGGIMIMRMMGGGRK